MAQEFKVKNGLIVDQGGAIITGSISATGSLTVSGNIGIGTTTDAGFKLDVNGSARVSGQLTVSGNIVTPSNANFSGQLAVGSSVIIGTTSFGINGSCLLELRSTTKGFLPPRMTTTQKNAIATPAAGLMVYDTDLSKVNFYNGASWNNTGLGVAQVTPVTLASGSWSLASSLYEYDYSNALITSSSIVDIIPDNSTISIVQAAQILPSTVSTSGSVKLFATNLPTADIIVTVNIFN